MIAMPDIAGRQEQKLLTAFAEESKRSTCCAVSWKGTQSSQYFITFKNGNFSWQDVSQVKPTILAGSKRNNDVCSS